ncbi:hypothetical protein LXL04_019568 [Taraxacum kok-saghyz]
MPQVYSGTYAFQQPGALYRHYQIKANTTPISWAESMAYAGIAQQLERTAANEVVASLRHLAYKIFGEHDELSHPCMIFQAIKARHVKPTDWFPCSIHALILKDDKSGKVDVDRGKALSFTPKNWLIRFDHRSMVYCLRRNSKAYYGHGFLLFWKRRAFVTNFLMSPFLSCIFDSLCSLIDFALFPHLRMIKAHLILSQTRLIFSMLTDFSSVLTEFNSICSDLWSKPDPNPTRSTTRVYKKLNPNFSLPSQNRPRH